MQLSHLPTGRRLRHCVAAAPAGGKLLASQKPPPHPTAQDNSSPCLPSTSVYVSRIAVWFALRLRAHQPCLRLRSCQGVLSLGFACGRSAPTMEVEGGSTPRRPQRPNHICLCRIAQAACARLFAGSGRRPPRTAPHVLPCLGRLRLLGNLIIEGATGIRATGQPQEAPPLASRWASCPLDLLELRARLPAAPYPNRAQSDCHAVIPSARMESLCVVAQRSFGSPTPPSTQPRATPKILWANCRARQSALKLQN